MKRIVLFLILLILLTGCSRNLGEIKDGYTNFGNLNLPQFESPEEGEEIAVITTNKGDIKVKLLDEVAPIGVEQFKKWVEEGKYEGAYFGSISKDRNIMIHGKELEKDMTEEEGDKYYLDIVENMSFDDSYELETSPDYLHFSGALGFAHYNDPSLSYMDKPVGMFYIVANEGLSEEMLELLEDLSAKLGFTKDTIDAYRYLGGVLDYNGNYTVFGQVFYGMDIVYEINNMTIDNSGFPTEEPVVIEKIEIVKYEGK